MPSWPTVLPAVTGSFSADISNRVRRTTMESGRVRQHPVALRTNKTFKAVWEMTDFQFGMFKAFVLRKLNGGELFFTVNLPENDAFVSHSVRVSGGKYSAQSFANLHWRVSANLDLEN